MSDVSFRFLLPFLQPSTESTLCVADENLLHSAGSISHQPTLSIITNRFDVYAACQKSGLRTEFSDYDFSAINDNSLDQIVYRVSKEKAVVNHIINQALRTLKMGGRLVLAGEKGEGIKTYIDKASKLLGQKTPASKHGTSYTASIRKTASTTHATPLDDQEYEQPRVIAELNNHSIYSKPGLFGWDKIDGGSRLLMDTADQYLEAKTEKPTSVLDLGCGYGYLTLRTGAWSFIQERAATDNNAAALTCMAKNRESFGLNVEISADDCGSNLSQQYQLIVCNPPFHQGFSTDSSLTKKFLHNAHQRLHKNSTALFVVNQFIPLEKLASATFSQIDQLQSDGKFKVLALTK